MKSYIAFLLICLGFAVKSQDLDKGFSEPEELIQNLFRQQQSADIAYESFYEALFQFYQNPLDLNSASPDELRSIYLLTDPQIADLRAHLLNHGPLLSLYELQSIESFDVETIRSIWPFVTITSEASTWNGLRKALKKPDQHYVLFRHSRDLELAKGYRSPQGTPAYAGDPNALYLRYRFQKYKTYSIGLTMEKDPGEQLKINTSQYGADFLSFHAMAMDRKHFKKLVIGDYQLQFGQGLVLSGGFFLGKGAETILAVRRSSVGIRPYTSALETNFFRGTTCTWKANRFELTPFVSYKNVDAALLEQDTLSGDLASLRYTGLHRTSSELAARHTLTEVVYGSNAQYNSRNNKWQIGLNAMGIDYGKSLSPTNRPYNLHAFRGQHNANYGAYYSCFWRNLSFFGEIAQSYSGGIGGIQGLLLSMGHRIDLSVVYRNYAVNLHTPFGNGFGENFSNSNEEGMYWGIKTKLTQKTEFGAFFDSYRFPWLKYRASAPSIGHEYMANVRHKFNKKTLLFVQYRFETKEKDEELVEGDRQLSFHTRQNFVLQLEMKADKQLYFKSRIQGSNYVRVGQKTMGFLLSQDIGFNGRKVDVAFRTSLFDTDDFDNRQYAYEQDVMYAFSFPFYSGKGFRNYGVIRFNVNKKLSFWIKFGRTIYFDREQVGTGTEEIQGNTRSEIRWQCLLRL